MNVSELARKLKITTDQLHEVLPQIGIDIGRRAIKIDDRTAFKVLREWPRYQHLLASKAETSAEEAVEVAPKEKTVVTLPAVITVRDFAVALNIPVTKLIQTLMNNGILAALNEKIDYDTAAIIAEDLGFVPQKKSADDQSLPTPAVTDPIREIIEHEDREALAPRPPIIVVMGHVDHGKTTLLDALRQTNVVAGESGGITQHIGAYQVSATMKKTGEQHLITFLDTPGHEAFTTMRSRGARVADIAILVVAADDGVKPQTIEAIKIIQAAGTPMVVAINKMDKPDANIDRVKRELSDHGLIPEDWGGKTTCVPISAKAKTGLDDLLEVILIVAEMEQDKIVANPNGATVATVIESHIDKNEGPLATVLVQNGTLAQNDYLIIDNTYYGRVRAMRDYRGQLVKHALPSQPVKIIGFKSAPVVGYIVRAEKTLDRDIEKAKRTASQSVVVTPKHEKNGAKSVNLLLKTDTLGSLEAIANALLKLEQKEVKVTIVAKDLGAVTTADVLKAEATGSYIAGFHVDVSPSAEQLAGEKSVEIKSYRIIYELLDDVKERMESLLSPEISRTTVGSAKILALFRSDGSTMIVGGSALEGVLEPGMRARILRNGQSVGEGKIIKLQSGKQEIPSVKSGQEFGMSFEGKVPLAVGDVMETFKEEKIKRTLES